MSDGDIQADDRRRALSRVAELWLMQLDHYKLEAQMRSYTVACQSIPTDELEEAVRLACDRQMEGADAKWPPKPTEIVRQYRARKRRQEARRAAAEWERMRPGDVTPEGDQLMTVAEALDALDLLVHEHPWLATRRSRAAHAETSGASPITVYGIGAAAAGLRACVMRFGDDADRRLCMEVMA